MTRPPPSSPLFPYTTLSRPPSGALEQHRRVARLPPPEPACRHDGDAACRQIAQVALVTVPAEHRRWIPQRDSRALEPDHPAKELLQPMVVVPAGADDDALELFPAHVGGDRKSTRLNSSHLV